MKYEYQTTEQLIKTVNWIDTEAEATEQEKATAKNLIKKELKKRFETVLKSIDNGTCGTNPEAVINCLING